MKKILCAFCLTFCFCSVFSSAWRRYAVVAVDKSAASEDEILRAFADAGLLDVVSKSSEIFPQWLFDPIYSHNFSQNFLTMQERKKLTSIFSDESGKRMIFYVSENNSKKISDALKDYSGSYFSESETKLAEANQLVCALVFFFVCLCLFFLFARKFSFALAALPFLFFSAFSHDAAFFLAAICSLGGFCVLLQYERAPNVFFAIRINFFIPFFFFLALVSAVSGGIKTLALFSMTFCMSFVLLIVFFTARKSFLKYGSIIPVEFLPRNKMLDRKILAFCTAFCALFVSIVYLSVFWGGSQSSHFGEISVPICCDEKKVSDEFPSSADVRAIFKKLIVSPFAKLSQTSLDAHYVDFSQSRDGKIVKSSERIFNYSDDEFFNLARPDACGTILGLFAVQKDFSSIKYEKLAQKNFQFGAMHYLNFLVLLALQILGILLLTKIEVRLKNFHFGFFIGKGDKKQ